MSRVVTWLQQRENRMFCWVNQRIQHTSLDFFFTTITHLGGASIAITTALCLALFGQGVWKTAGIYSCLALALSHIPVAIIKRKYPRLRPYLVLPDTNTYKKPLKDHSFPSGHTTAIFSIVLPLVCVNFWIGAILLPLAVLVAISRIYLGLHYPSDCLAGAFIGTLSALSIVAFFG
ncbi:phosphatase PAP2 family protein [Paenibacillus sp. LMG 31456]|uniref:Phosphatase PAP2 family protein n=1 Tax=Paenibacillus foliorum TaxID=2654974 RepID=A0A972GN39_9BACL|nr:phosphatase PAP2 family protein [Paenibacillus foliorum]NOU93065.1 phosphatase PAP2 family protein [Paenibacillus foliorum]